MILIVTNQADYTADFLILKLIQQGIDFVRFNTEDFPQKVQLSVEFAANQLDGALSIQNRELKLKTITGIWYRRPVPSVISDSIVDPAAKQFAEAECREALEGFWRIVPAFWISNPDQLRIAESKMLQLAKAARLGFVIPKTLITNSPQSALDFYKTRNTRLIYKPLRYAQITREDRNGLIYTNVIEEQHAAQLETIQYAPGIFQPYIAKQTELRVTVVGSQVFAVEIHSQDVPEAQQDWRRTDAIQLRHTPYTLPESIASKCITLTQQFGLAFGAIDLILNPDGEYIFLELNPNGQWAWIEQICPEIHISDAMIDLLRSQESRSE